VRVSNGNFIIRQMLHQNTTGCYNRIFPDFDTRVDYGIGTYYCVITYMRADNIIRRRIKIGYQQAMNKNPHKIPNSGKLTYFYHRTCPDIIANYRFTHNDGRCPQLETVTYSHVFSYNRMMPGHEPITDDTPLVNNGMTSYVSITPNLQRPLFSSV